VDKLLKLSAESFLEGDGVEVDMTKREVSLSYDKLYPLISGSVTTGAGKAGKIAIF